MGPVHHQGAEATEACSDLVCGQGEEKEEKKKRGKLNAPGEGCNKTPQGVLKFHQSQRAQQLRKKWVGVLKKKKRDAGAQTLGYWIKTITKAETQ